MPSPAAFIVPAGALLGVTAAADALAAPTAAFYLFLLGIPVSVAAALSTLARGVEAEARGRSSFIAQVEAWLAAVLVAAFVVGAAARSPVALVVGTPGLARAALALGFLVLVLLALAALAPVRR